MNKIKLHLLLFVALLTSLVTKAQTATGPATLCIGHPANYFGTPTGGTWSSSSIGIGSIDPTTGIASGISAGTCTFTYTLPTSSYATFTATVAIPPTPGIVTGADTICLGGSTTFSSTLGGGAWSSSNPAIAGVSAGGVVTGYSLGITTISHTVSSGGCMASGTHTIVVMPAVTIWMPVSTTMCTGYMMAASASLPGGTWTSSDPTRATVSSTGVIMTLAAGYTTIVYTLPSGCSASMLITVVPAPAPITGPTTVCDGYTITLADAVGGGTWSSTTPSIATVGMGTGIVSGLAAGTTTIEYTMALGCSVTTTITVLPPVSISAGGPATVCTGSTLTLTGSPTGGTWSTVSSSISLSGGVVTGVSTGSAPVTYTSTGGCATVIIVSVMPVPGAISGTATVCAGATTTLTNTVSGGIWSSSDIAVATIGAATGVITGIAPGTATITYTLATGCYTTRTVTVTPAAAITGTGSVCVGSTLTLSGTPTGGTWTTVSSSVSLSGGVVTGVASGMAVITYAASTGCATTTIVTVNATPAAIGGTGVVCAGSSTTFTCSPTGGTWSSSTPAVGAVDVGTGVATGISSGTTVITYTIGTGCYSTIAFTVNALPTVSASATGASCGPTYTLSASGATTYVWSPATGLSCTTCSSPVTTPGATTTYTVTGTTAGCSGTATATITVDRIYGHISFSSTAPSTPALKVWLIQFNTSDSSITSTDSATSCSDGGTEYYQFDSKPAGNYLVKAKLLSAVAGTSDYIPTYGSSTPNWYAAASIAHTAGGVDVQDINMIFGTVPAGPGFISGYVYSGAGKGTSGDIPVEGMMIYLKDDAGNVLTYTYTTAAGLFSFPSLAYGSYVIYPEEQSYYTTPSDVITLSAEAPGYSTVNFRQYLTSGVIRPAVSTSIFTVATQSVNNGIFPNPARDVVNIQVDEQAAGSATVSLTDVTGRIVLSQNTEINAKGQARVNVSGIAAGMYIMHITSAHTNLTEKLTIE